ncbi:MAG: prolyl oligopeptidase family serine peptidase [Terriglobales bacterium]
MRRTIRQTIFLMACSAMLLSLSVGVAEASGVKTYKGKFADGATYLMQVPSNWNGTLVLYSHGYVVPGFPNPAEDVGDPITGAYLLANGYALAGSSYATTGWAIQQALPDQIKVLDTFKTRVGTPTRTIAWGHSLGGMVTAGLVQRYPTRFDAALPMCGVVAGGVGTWNQALDSAFAFDVLLGANSGLHVVNITNPNKNIGIAEGLLADAQKTAKGKARIALTAALDDTPGWYDPLSPEPSPTDYVTQEANQYLWLANIDFPFAFDFRAELEDRASGNPSWNNGVDYEKQLKNSVDYPEVQALYQKASLSLDDDIQALNNYARIKAKQSSVAYLEQNIIFNGQIHIPVLTLHTKGDGLVVVEDESAYKQVVDEEHDGELLRQLFVHRAGHCEFTPAETVVAFQALISRLDTGKWPGLGSAVLNNTAKGLGSTFNVLSVNGKRVHVPPAYFKFQPAVFLRPFDAGKD